MGISVKLQVFEGPLDLLLHLIDKNKVNIYDIPIAMITEQYMEYVEQLKKEDLNVVSEFLVMAATLLDIKSRMLLPKEVDEEGNEEDPRAANSLNIGIDSPSFPNLPFGTPVLIEDAFILLVFILFFINIYFSSFFLK